MGNPDNLHKEIYDKVWQNLSNYEIRFKYEEGVMQSTKDEAFRLLKENPALLRQKYGGILLTDTVLQITIPTDIDLASPEATRAALASLGMNPTK